MWVYFLPLGMDLYLYFFGRAASRRVAPLASGYPLHHLHPFGVRWFRYYPSRFRRFAAGIAAFGGSGSRYASIKYFGMLVSSTKIPVYLLPEAAKLPIPATRARSAILDTRARSAIPEANEVSRYLLPEREARYQRRTK